MDERAPAAGSGAGRALGLLAGAMGVLGGLALYALMGVTLVSVIWRYLLRDPIFGIEDLSTMALTVFVAGAVAWGAWRGAHVSVNVISRLAGRRVTRATDALARLLGLCIVGFAAWGLAVKGTCGMPCGAMTPNMGIVHSPFYFVLSAGFAVYALILAWQLALGLKHWRGDDPNEAPD